MWQVILEKIMQDSGGRKWGEIATFMYYTFM